MFDDTDKRESFRRQRRNLMAVSIATAFYEAAGLKFPQLNLLGNMVEIEKPEIVSAAITIAFIYFLWRYYTACREVGGIPRFFSACNIWASERARAYVTRKYVKPNRNKYESAELIKGRYVELTFRLRRNNQGLPEENVTVRERYWIYQIVSWIPTTLQTSNFTEYVLPYLLALIAALQLLGFELVEQFTQMLQRH